MTTPQEQRVLFLNACIDLSVSNVLAPQLGPRLFAFLTEDEYAHVNRTGVERMKERAHYYATLMDPIDAAVAAALQDYANRIETPYE